MRENTILFVNVGVSPALHVARKLVLDRKDNLEVFLTDDVSEQRSLAIYLAGLKKAEKAKAIKDDAVRSVTLEVENRDGELRRPVLKEFSNKMSQRHIAGIVYATRVQGLEFFQQTFSECMNSVIKSFAHEDIPVALIVGAGLAGMQFRFTLPHPLNSLAFRSTLTGDKESLQETTNRIYKFLLP